MGAEDFIMDSAQTILSQYLPYIPSVISVLGDICLFFISVYTFRLTILPKKLHFISFSPSFSDNGNSVTVVLENRSLCTVAVRAVYILQGTCKLKIFDGNCLIESFKAADITSEKYSELITDDGSPFQLSPAGKILLCVETTRGDQYIKLDTPMFPRLFKRKRDQYRTVTMHIKQWYGKIVMPGYKYGLAFKDSGGALHVSFLHTSGFIIDSPFEYNAIPKDWVADDNKVADFFKNELAKHHIRSFVLDRVDRQSFDI